MTGIDHEQRQRSIAGNARQGQRSVSPWQVHPHHITCALPHDPDAAREHHQSARKQQGQEHDGKERETPRH